MSSMNAPPRAPPRRRKRKSRMNAAEIQKELFLYFGQMLGAMLKEKELLKIMFLFYDPVLGKCHSRGCGKNVTSSMLSAKGSCRRHRREWRNTYSGDWTGDIGDTSPYPTWMCCGRDFQGSDEGDGCEVTDHRVWTTQG